MMIAAFDVGDDYLNCLLPLRTSPFCLGCDQAIMYDKVKIADAVNVKVISLDDAPKGYTNFDKGESVKYVIDPHGVTGKTEKL